MVPQAPSIQSFFQPEVPSVASDKPARRSNSKADTNNGFSSSEVEHTVHPALHRWQPRTAYDEVDVGSLVPGPGCVAMTGRVVNFYDQTINSKMPQAAKGCLKVIVKDDTGAILVKLWYAKVEYGLRLGHLVSFWTPHVSNAESGSGSSTLQNGTLVSSIFPERDNSCYFMVQESSDEGILCKTPLGYRNGKQLDRLITLKKYIDGGHAVLGVKVLVCVKSIGGRKKFTTKKGDPAEKVDVNIFDDTEDATLTLWGRTAASASSWKASCTVLLITNPGFKSDRRPTLSLTQGTYVDVDPCMTDADWLRGYAQRLMKREHINQPFPEGVFDLDAAAESETKTLFTLADIDEFARTAPTGKIIGYLSLTIIELHIYSLYQRNMLFSTECCGLPITANTPTTTCKQCASPLLLRPNPRLIGLLIDETGAITSGKLLWSDTAWHQLLGRDAPALAAIATRADVLLLRYLEQRLLFLRVALRVGWSGGLGVGRVVVMGVSIV